MTPQQIDAIRGSFGKILLQRDEAAKVFYDRLFEIAPEARAMFKGDMAAQRKKLMETVSFLVAELRNLEHYTVMLEDLAKRHVKYGAERAHYESVGAALLWMLERQLGPAFTPQLKTAWLTLYTSVSGTMQRAAYQSAA